MNKQFQIPKHTGDKELDHVTTLEGYGQLLANCQAH